MKLKDKTRAILAFMTLLVLLGLFRIVYIVEASPEVVVYVDPPEVLDVAVGETFDIYIIASDVEDLFLTEIYLSWDPTILYTDIGSINPGDVAPYLEQIWIEEVDNDEGWLHVSSGRPLGVKEGLSGTVQIAKVTFLVEGEGSCDLHFFDNLDTVEEEPRLKDSTGDDLERTVEDGLFSNSPHDIAITSVTASPTIVTPGDTVNINVTVKNQGTETETFNVTAYNRGYLVLSPDGDGTYTDWEGDYTYWDDWPSLDTLVVRATSDGKYESSTLANHTAEDWPIDKVIVSIVARNAEASDEEVRLMLVIGGTEYLGSAYAPPNVPYTKYTSEWTTNPATGSAWTWSDIDALEAGVGSEQVGHEWTGQLRVTQLYVEVIGISIAVSPEETVTLPARDSTTLEFSWNTTGFAGGTYTIKAEADAVPDEKNTANNVKEADDKVTIQIRDIAITSVTTEPTKVVVGDRVSIQVTVVNKGNVPETFNVSVYYDSILIENKTTTGLVAGDRKVLVFEWFTTDVPEGNYTIRAEAPPLPGEVNTTNNVKEADDKVFISLHNIEVKQVKASPSMVVVGDPVSINVTIRNNGKVEETFNASVYYDTTLIETRTGITLSNGTSTILEFTWDTTVVAEDTYTIKAEVPPVPGEVKTDDNKKETQVIVLAPLIHDIAIAFVEAYPTRVTPGQQVYIDVTVVNEGTASETFDVTVYYDTTIIGTATVWRLPPKASYWLKFVWDTTGVAEGTYAISAEADVVPRETDTADNVYINGTVTVSVPKITISPSSGPIGTKVTVKGSGFPYGMSGYLMFDDELVGFIFADIYGNFNATLNVPLSEAGPHTIKAIILYYPYPSPVETTFTVIDVTLLEIEMDVGTLYFKGETAEFYVQTALKGTPVDITSVNAFLYKPDKTTEALTVQQIATGLYKMTYAIRGKGSMKGTYTLVVEASYTTSTVDATGTSIKTFLVKDPYKTLEKEAPKALSLIAVIGTFSALVIVWRRKEHQSTR